MTARPPLGIAGGSASDLELTVGLGDALLLYTDGLIERRGESLDRGLERLLVAVSDRFSDAGALADRIIEAMCGDLNDDCCLLVIHRQNGSNRDEAADARVRTDEQL
jgi:serine phosphatase RsbU (regulator of sigma subunit)